jgi:hypothetical protein
MAHYGGEYDIDGGNTHRRKSEVDPDGFVFDPDGGDNSNGRDDGWCIGPLSPAGMTGGAGYSPSCRSRAVSPVLTFSIRISS